MSKLKEQINFYRVDDISQIINHEDSPYQKGKKVITNCDIDGVIACGGEKDTPEENLKRVLHLRRIAENSDKITIDSCRFIEYRSSKKCILCPPLINSRFAERLENILGKEKVEVKNGIGKLFTCFGVDDGFFRTNLDNLKNGADVSIIGNSLMDTIRVRLLVNRVDKNNKDKNNKKLDLKKIYYFKTPGYIF